jgi:hypothetical protein
VDATVVVALRVDARRERPEGMRCRAHRCAKRHDVVVDENVAAFVVQEGAVEDGEGDLRELVLVPAERSGPAALVGERLRPFAGGAVLKERVPECA